MLWYTKSRRAQSNTDYETWVEGGVIPTLNSFDNGDVRATTIIFYGNRVADIRLQKDVVNTLQARMGTGGNNMPMVAVIPIHDKATRSGGKRKLHNGEYAFDGAGNGFGVGENGDPMNTLTQGDRHAVAISSVEESEEDEMQKDLSVIGTLQARDYKGVGNQYVEENKLVVSDNEQSNDNVEDSIVRRLTPTECERLQGFPDGWTDGQSDTNRYKQMGNAVTVNVAQWVFSRLADRL